VLSNFLPLLAPLALIIAAVLAFRGAEKRPGMLLRIVEGATLFALAAAVLSAFRLMNEGSATSGLIGFAGLGISARLDAVSVVMLLLVSFIGWVVVRYSATYMDGEPRQGPFTGWLCATLAAVMMLVIAGNILQLALAWVATSLFLHKLLLHYPNRVAAQRAAHKKWITARIGDGALLIAVVLLFARYDTGDIAEILAAARMGEGQAGTGWIAAALAIAAILKSAQFPTHGWLTEVMETPTPVSALLHAGVINAGGFLLIRFADVMLLAPAVLAVLVMVGGFTALFGSLVMLTQSAVKTSLAWSTVAQMGFMILQCGLALFPLALLHIVAHSLYKAHAFLASGMAVDSVAEIRRPGPVAIPNGLAVGRAFIFALIIYGIVAFLFGVTGKSPQAIALGAILIFGVAYLLAQGLADAAPRVLTQRTAVFSVAAAVGYFTLQNGAEWMMSGTLPATPSPGLLEWALIILTLLSFGLVAVAQTMLPLWANHPTAAGMRVHLSNGLYANAVFDKLLPGSMISNSDIPFTARLEALKHIKLAVNSQVLGEVKSAILDWVKTPALKANGVNEKGSKTFDGLGISIAIITFGLFGLPLILTSFF
jgi:NAD(P)H-quinone oxidoreductase subunit 5